MTMGRRVNKMDLRKIDALVAEKVMGNVFPADRCRICGWTLKESIVEGCTAESCSLRPAPTRRADEPAYYSSDPEAARRVREKLYERWDWLLGHGGNPKEKPFALALYEKGVEVVQEVFIADADTEELAICLCALRSVGVEVQA